MRKFLLTTMLFGALVTPAVAQSYTPIQVDCMKQYGASENPTTHRLSMVSCSSICFQQKLDAIYSCVAQKTGKPVTPFINQRTWYVH